MKGKQSLFRVGNRYLAFAIPHGEAGTRKLASRRSSSPIIYALVWYNNLNPSQPWI